MPEIKNPFEIERKWMVYGWPQSTVSAPEDNRDIAPSAAATGMNAADTDTRASSIFPLLKEEIQNQGYVTVEPTVRIREENVTKSNDPDFPVADNYILCFKSKGLLSRREIEMPIEKHYFDELRELIGFPLIPKVRRTYRLPDGHLLEVNHVDEGAPTEFWYAEIEFCSEEEAEHFDPATVGLGTYLNDDVTKQPGQSMGAYWTATRTSAPAGK